MWPTMTAEPIWPGRGLPVYQPATDVLVGTCSVPCAVLGGHIASYQGPGGVFRLRLLRPGDSVYVRRANGTLAVFRVYAERSYAKDHFPTQRVYGPAPDPELHLITCGGIFDPAIGSYLSNVVVYANQIR